MALLASFSAAAEVWKGVAERRAGRDPSAQEDEGVVRPFLWEASRQLDTALMRLQATLAYLPDREEAYLPGLVRRFESLITLHRVVRLLQRVHQRLLSLYPAVPEALVETARTLHREAEALLDPESSWEEAVTPFLARALRFPEALRQALNPRP